MSRLDDLDGLDTGPACLSVCGLNQKVKIIRKETIQTKTLT